MQTLGRNPHIFSVDPWPKARIAVNPSLLESLLTRTDKKILDFVVSRANLKFIYVSQTTIANAVECCRQTVYIALAKLERLGLIASSYRFWKTKLYRISTWFSYADIKQKLSNWLNAVKWLPQPNPSLLITSYFDKNIIKKDALEAPRFSIRKELENRFFQKREKVMNEENPIPQSVRDIKFMSLTRWGQIELSVFPDQAITDTISRYKYAMDVKDPFKWFCKMCHEHCEREGIRKEWERYNRLKEAYPMPPNARMILTEKPIVYHAPQPAPVIQPPVNRYSTYVEPKPRAIQEIEQEIQKITEKLLDEEAIKKTIPFMGENGYRGNLERCLNELAREYSKALTLAGLTEPNPVIQPLAQEINLEKSPQSITVNNMQQPEQINDPFEDDLFQDVVDWFGELQEERKEIVNLT